MSRTVLHIHAKVLEGHRIEVLAPALDVGDEVDIVILGSEEMHAEPRRKSAIDIIREMPPAQLFASVAEIDAYLKEERDSWER